MYCQKCGDGWAEAHITSDTGGFLHGRGRSFVCRSCAHDHDEYWARRRANDADEGRMYLLVVLIPLGLLGVVFLSAVARSFITN